MNMDSPAFQKNLHSKVKQLQPYVPGRSITEIQNQYQIQDVIKLASNENPLGCSPKVIEDIHKIQKFDISIYPSTTHHPLYAQLTDFLEISHEHLLITNGSDAVFSLLIQAYTLAFQKKILTHEYAFMGYEIQAASFGIETLKAPIDPKTWLPDIDELIRLSKNDVALIFIANPNNPTGQKIQWWDIYTLLNNIPAETLLIIDEAYFEYDESPHPQMHHLLSTYPNLIITRTFSKAYGLAALRIGYTMAHPVVIDTLKRIQLPFTINQVALNAANIALNDQAFIEKTVKLNREGMQDLIEKLSSLALITRSSFGNFITIEYHKDIKEMVIFLESQGVIIRSLHAFGLARVARITIGTQAQNQRLIKTIQQFFSKDKKNE